MALKSPRHIVRNPCVGFRPRLCRLEERTVPAGTTIITHGYSLSGSAPLEWMRQMGDAIADRAGGAVQLDYNSDLPFASGQVRLAGTSTVVNPVDIQSNSEYVVYVLWGESSNNAAPGFVEAAADGLYSILSNYRLVGPQRPVHFIGHSFGTVLNSETIQRLGYFDGVNVDQMTLLDPHDFDEQIGLGGNYIDTAARLPDVQIWSNVRYSDNYFNLAGGIAHLTPHGRDVPGSARPDLTNLTSKNGFGNETWEYPLVNSAHSRVHDYYANTISTSLINVNEFGFHAVNQNQWYFGNPLQIGFFYSRLGGASASQRQEYFGGPLLRASLVTPPPATTPGGANDVGRDPPQSIFNGDFFIHDKTTNNELAGYTNPPELFANPMTQYGWSARLSSADTQFVHDPVLFASTTTGFQFEYNVTATNSKAQLFLNFTPEGGATLQYPGTISLPAAGGSGTYTVDSSWPQFSTLLGKRVEVSFLLATPQTNGADLWIDDQTLLSDPRIVAYVEGSNELIVNGAAVPVSFGTASLSQGPITRTIVVVNSGSSPLDIQAPTVSPGVTVSGAAFPLTIPAGEARTFDLHMNPMATGHFTGQVSFATNDPAQSVFEFTFSTTITKSQPFTNEVIAGAISVPGELDRYYFTGQAGRTLTVSAFWGGGPGFGGGLHSSGAFRLFGPDGTLLAAPINDIHPGSSYRFSRLDEFTLPADGTYVVEVRHAGQGTGAYSLGISDPLAYFVPLSNSQPTPAQFEVRGDVQEYAFNTIAGQTLGWRYDGVRPLVRWSILDPSGTQVSGGTNTGTSVTMLFTPAATGTYNLTFEDEKAASWADIGGIGPFDYSLFPVPIVTFTRVNDGSQQRSMVTSLTIELNSAVTFAGSVANAFTLTRNGGGSVAFQATANIVNGVTVVTLNNFTGPETQFGSLRDGRFTLTALASQISNAGGQLNGGNNYTFGDAQGLFRLFGDFNGDRQVDGIDFSAFSSTFNLTSLQAGFLAMFDINGDGQIDGFDFGHFSGRFNTVLP